MSASPPLDLLARDHAEGGTVVILGAVVLALALALVVGLGQLGRAHISRARAQLAADAAALGAAAERAEGGDCGGSRVVAENLAAANKARLE
ncbi:MAG: pilus assembly protein TadG-related protein, partial [Acidimicrobiia bacterium]